MVTDLCAVADGRKTLDEFVNIYGARCDGENELSKHSWRENRQMLQTLVEKYRTDPAYDVRRDDVLLPGWAARRLH